VIAGKKVSVLTRGPKLSARWEKELGTDSGLQGSGLWADSDVGPDRSPRPFSYFLFFSYFPFSVFLFLLYLLHIWFKLLQTNFVINMFFTI
jgi:hypothetical protein